jgi:hypothetical protein
MKKVILASVLGVVAVASVGSANAASTAQIFCSGSPTSVGTASITSATEFVKVAFTPKCSSNTHVTGSDSTTYYRVGSASTKGKTSFAGSSMGGGVVAAGLCAATGNVCAVSDATTAMTSTYAATS